MYPVDPFNPREDAQRLRDAMAGFGTDESAIIDVLCRRPADQRVIVTLTYYDVFGRVFRIYFIIKFLNIIGHFSIQDLIRDLNSELLPGVFQDLALTLPLPMALYLANELFDAMFLFSSDDVVLTEILMTRSNAELEQIRLEYLKSNKNKLIM